MSIPAIQELIAGQQIDAELLSQFIDFNNGQVVQRFECEYWDYKRQLYPLDDRQAVAELARDVLAFHNTRGGYIVFGITKQFTAIGIHDHAALELESTVVNEKIRQYIGTTFYCKYATISGNIGGVKKTFAAILIPARKGTAIPVARNAPEPDPLFKKGDLFLRANDKSKRAETDLELSFLYSPVEAELLVGRQQLSPYVPRPGVRLFKGDYIELIGKDTRLPKVNQTIDALLYEKWDVVLLNGIGGIGKTAVAIEATRRLAEDSQQPFGGIFSISCKTEQLTPYERRGLKPEVVSYEEFLREFLNHAVWDGPFPERPDEREKPCPGNHHRQACTPLYRQL
jgi:hypothetical protein